MKVICYSQTIFTLSFCFVAGDLEIVCNGTRRHTRDVGTTFPSPRESRASMLNSSSLTSVGGGGGGGRSSSKTQSSQKQRKSKRSPSKPYPEGLSAYVTNGISFLSNVAVII